MVVVVEMLLVLVLLPVVPSLTAFVPTPNTPPPPHPPPLLLLLLLLLLPRCRRWRAERNWWISLLGLVMWIILYRFKGLIQDAEEASQGQVRWWWWW